MEQANCKEGLEPNIIDKVTFSREIELCKQLSKTGQCCWGECDKCGVIPLLVKLHEGVLLDKKEEIQGAKNRLLKKENR